MKKSRLYSALLFLAYYLLTCACLFAQEEAETGLKYKPRERNLLIDIPLTIGEVTLINLAGNVYWRLWGPDSEAAYFTLDSIRANLNPRVWGFELGQGGDTFL